MNNNIFTPKPIKTYSDSSLNIIDDTAKKLKQMFKEANKLDSCWAVYDERTNEFVGVVDYE